MTDKEVEEEIVSFLDPDTNWKNEPKPELTLEWMLGKLLDKGYKIDQMKFGYKYCCSLFYKYGEDFDENGIGEVRETPTLALRGAVVKLIESEKTNNSVGGEEISRKSSIKIDDYE